MKDRVRKQYLYRELGVCCAYTDIARLHSYTVRFTTEESEMNRMVRVLPRPTDA
jgi:hypothetical protein